MESFWIRFHHRPALGGALVGVLVLAPLHVAGMYFYLAWADSNFADTRTPDPIFYLLRLGSGVLWGIILGRAAGLALFGLRTRQYWKGRQRLINTAFGTAFLQFALLLLFLTSRGNLHLETEVMIRLLVYILTNACFQMSLLLWVVGMFLPKHVNKLTQVTEKLRL